jgi:MoxR-like ATPase
VLLAAQAYALADGREFVLPEDVRATLPVVVPHRLVLSAEARIENLDAPTVLQRVVSAVPVPTGVR